MQVTITDPSELADAKCLYCGHVFKAHPTQNAVTLVCPGCAKEGATFNPYGIVSTAPEKLKT